MNMKMLFTIMLIVAVNQFVAVKVPKEMFVAVEESMCNVMGPKYWCSSPERSKICSAQMYCKNELERLAQIRMATIFGKRSCFVCRKLMGAFKKLFSIDHAVRMVLQMSCARLQGEIAMDLCNRFITEHAAELFQNLHSKMDADILCQKIKICPAPTPAPVEPTPELPTSEGPTPELPISEEPTPELPTQEEPFPGWPAQEGPTPVEARPAGPFPDFPYPDFPDPAIPSSKKSGSDIPSWKPPRYRCPPCK